MCREALSTTLFSPGPAVAHPHNQERLHSSLYRETALIVHCLTSDRQILVSIPRHPARRQVTASPPITSLFDFDFSLFKFCSPFLLCLFFFFFFCQIYNFWIARRSIQISLTQQCVSIVTLDILIVHIRGYLYTLDLWRVDCRSEHEKIS